MTIPGARIYAIVVFAEVQLNRVGKESSGDFVPTLLSEVCEVFRADRRVLAL